MEGYITLHRQIINSEVFANPNDLKIWLWVLLKANFDNSFDPTQVGLGCKTVNIERGQFIFGRYIAEKELKMSGSMIYRTMQKFKESGMILIESNNQYSVVTVCKYNDYQLNNKKSEQQMNSVQPAFDSDLTCVRPTFDSDLNTSKKEKKDNNKSVGTNGFKKTASTPHTHEGDKFLDELETDARDNLIMQYLSTTVLSESEKEVFILRIASNNYCKFVGGTYHRIKISQLRPEAEYCKKQGWLEIKVNTNKPEQQKIVDGGVFQ
jgi:biotin operon repressor